MSQAALTLARPRIPKLSAILLILGMSFPAGAHCCPEQSRNSRKSLYLLAFIFFLLALPARSQPVDVALVLAVDVSGSISDASWTLQRDGIADAIGSPGFAQALSQGQIGRVAIAVIQWGTAARVIVPWRVLESAAEARALAAEIRANARFESGGTCMGTAIRFATRELDAWADNATRRVIDVSGDGASNCGIDFPTMQAAAIAEGITINGLPIVTPIEPKIAEWYADNVIGGPGAFLIVAEGYRDFADAFRKKLTIEVAEVLP